MVLADLIFLQLDGIRPLHMIDCSKLAFFGADNGHVGVNLVGINHGFFLLAQSEPVVLIIFIGIQTRFENTAIFER